MIIRQPFGVMRAIWQMPLTLKLSALLYVAMT